MNVVDGCECSNLKEHLFTKKVLIQLNVGQLDGLLIVHYIYSKIYAQA